MKIKNYNKMISIIILLSYSIIISTISAFILYNYYKQKKSYSLEINKLLSTNLDLNNQIEDFKKNLQDYSLSNALLKQELDLSKENNNKLTEMHNAKIETLENQNQNKDIMISELNENVSKQSAIIGSLKQQCQDKEKEYREILDLTKKELFSTTNEAVGKKAEEASKDMVNKIENIVKSINIHSHNIHDIKKQVTKIDNTIFAPLENGKISEIHLENIMKSYGLIAGVDFDMQYSFNVEGNKFVPDSVIWLPDNSLIVIDCKSSKYFAEYQNTENEQEKNELLKKLTKSMNEHLKQLGQKSYSEMIKKYFKKMGKEVNNIYNTMFISSEVMIEKILQADINFRNNAQKLGIIITGPTGLYSLLFIASRNIDQLKQKENFESILEHIHKLADYSIKMIDDLTKVGTRTKSALSEYDKLSRSLNKFFIPSINKLQELGISSNKKINKKLPKYDIIEADKEIIEMENNTDYIE